MKQPQICLITVSLLFSVTILFIQPSRVTAQTVSFDFTGATIGAGCETVVISPFIVSYINNNDSVTNTTNAGGTAPECQAPINTQITLTQAATAIAFRAFKGNGSIGIEYFQGATLVGTDNIPSGAIANYSRTLTFNRIRIFEVANLSPIYLDNIVLTFPDPATPAPPGQNVVSDPGFVPGDDRIAPTAGARFNVYCREYGLVIYVGSTVFIVEQSLLTTEIPTVNTLMVRQNGVSVYRLSDGLFQVMIAPDADGKQEFAIFEMSDGCFIHRWRRGQFDTRTVHSAIYAESSTSHWVSYPYDY
jgi:hypothetical protein